MENTPLITIDITPAQAILVLGILHNTYDEHEGTGRANNLQGIFNLQEFTPITDLDVNLDDLSATEKNIASKLITYYNTLDLPKPDDLNLYLTYLSTMIRNYRTLPLANDMGMIHEEITGNDDYASLKTWYTYAYRSLDPNEPKHQLYRDMTYELKLDMPHWEATINYFTTLIWG